MSVNAESCKKSYPVTNEHGKSIAVDVGANIGGFSMAYHKVFDKIIYFEANPETFKIAQSNLKSYSNVIGYNYAVSDEPNKIIPLFNHLNKDNGSVTCSPSVIKSKHPEWNDIIGEIHTISINEIYDMIGGEMIDYLKMDCENSEYEILLNKDLSRIKYIAMEIHWQMGQEKHNELLEYLSRFFSISGNSSFTKGYNQLIYLKKI